MAMIYTFLFFIISCLTLSSQNKVVEGVVSTKSGDLLGGIHILNARDSSVLGVTDVKGMFKIMPPLNSHVLIFHGLGYESIQVTTSFKKKPLRVVMQESYKQLDEAMIVKTKVDNLGLGSITKEQIEALDYGADLPSLLDHQLSTVSTSDAGNSFGYTGFRVRGNDITRVNVTLNGVPVNDQESQSVFFVNMGDIAGSLEKVDLQRGASVSGMSAPTYGASLALISSSINNDPELQYSGNVGSYDSYRHRVELSSGLIGEAVKMHLRYSKVGSDGYIDRASTDLSSIYSAIEADLGGVTIKGLYMWGKEKTYQAWDGISKQELEQDRRQNHAGEILEGDSVVGYYDNHTDNYIQRHTQLQVNHQIKGLRAEHKLYYTRGGGYYESYRNDKDLSDYGNVFSEFPLPEQAVGDAIDQKHLSNDFLGYALTLSKGGNLFSYALDLHYNYYNGEHFGRVLFSDIAPVPDPTQEWYNNQGIKQNYQASIRVNLQPLSTLNISSQLHFRHTDYSIDGLLDDQRLLQVSEQYNFVSPSLALENRLWRNGYITSSIALAYKEPPRVSFTDAGSEGIPDYERLLDIELGVRQRLKSWELGVNFFYMDYDNQLVQNGQLNDVGAYILTNVGRSFRYGVEVEIGGSLSESLRVDARGAFSRNRVKDFILYIDSWDTGRQEQLNLRNTDLSFSPSLIVGGDITYNFSPTNTTAVFSLRTVGDQFIDNTSSQDKRLPSYTLGDLVIHQPYRIKKVKLDFSFYIKNIFNRKYVSNAWAYSYIEGGEQHHQVGYYPQAGTNIMGGVSLTY